MPGWRGQAARAMVAMVDLGGDQLRCVTVAQERGKLTSGRPERGAVLPTRIDRAVRLDGPTVHGGEDQGVGGRPAPTQAPCDIRAAGGDDRAGLRPRFRHRYRAPAGRRLRRLDRHGLPRDLLGGSPCTCSIRSRGRTADQRNARISPARRPANSASIGSGKISRALAAFRRRRQSGPAVMDLDLFLRDRRYAARRLARQTFRHQLAVSHGIVQCLYEGVGGPDRCAG